MTRWIKSTASSLIVLTFVSEAASQQTTEMQCKYLVDLHLASHGAISEIDAEQLFQLFLDKSKGTSCDAKYEIPRRRTEPPQWFNIFYNPQSSQAIILKDNGQAIATYKLESGEIDALRDNSPFGIQRPFYAPAPPSSG